MRRGAVLLTAALALAGCGGDSESKPKPVKAESLPGYVVEADGHKVYFQCEGEGTPTVVFLSGWGEDSTSWVSVFDASSQMTRSCTYDRYGVGQTNSYGALPREARDARDQARELEQLLENAEIAKPYVLVGHSWGGALARLYAGAHEDAEGLVFVDASSPGQDAAFSAALPPRQADEPALFSELRDAASADPLENPENLEWGKSLHEVGEVKTLGDRPAIVITAGSTFAGGAEILFPVWKRLQNELANLSSASVHVLAPTSTHYVQNDAPDVVLASVRAVVTAVRDDGELAACAAIFRQADDAKCLPG